MIEPKFKQEFFDSIEGAHSSLVSTGVRIYEI